MVRDHTARELSVRAGAEVVCEQAIAGWAWVTDANGRAGWLPESRRARE
jgi:hypothetical protein